MSHDIVTSLEEEWGPAAVAGESMSELQLQDPTCIEGLATATGAILPEPFCWLPDLGCQEGTRALAAAAVAKLSKLRQQVPRQQAYSWLPNLCRYERLLCTCTEVD